MDKYTHMTLRAWGSGPLSLLDLQNEFGGAASTSITEYYRGANNGSGLIVRDDIIGYPGGVAAYVPTGGNISIANFYGASASRYSNTAYYSPLSGYTYMYLPYYAGAFNLYLHGGGGGGGGGAAEGSSVDNGIASGGGGGAGASMLFASIPANRFSGRGQYLAFTVGPGGPGAVVNTGNQGQDRDPPVNGQPGGGTVVYVYTSADNSTYNLYVAGGGGGGTGGSVRYPSGNGQVAGTGGGPGTAAFYPWGGAGQGYTSNLTRNIQLGLPPFNSNIVPTPLAGVNGAALDSRRGGTRPGGRGGASYYSDGGLGGTPTNYSTTPGAPGANGSGGGGGGAFVLTNENDGYATNAAQGGNGLLIIEYA